MISYATDALRTEATYYNIMKKGGVFHRAVEVDLAKYLSNQIAF